jgi:hypothetical protein
VFEDVNYGGGAGRDRATALAAGGSGRPGARVELYDSAGNFVAATTTDSAGAYTFSGLAGATFEPAPARWPTGLEPAPAAARLGR